MSDTLDEALDLAEELDGRIMSCEQVADLLKERRPMLNELYHNHGKLLWIGYGFNDGDDMLTVSARVI